MNKMGKADTKFWLKIITTEDIIRRIRYKGLSKFWAYYCKCGAVVDKVSWFN